MKRPGARQPIGATLGALGSVLPGPAQLRRSCRQARADNDWCADARQRRILCERMGAPASDWVQYGHALKETGFFLQAERAYRTAQARLRDDPEIALQLGHLLKVTDRFDEAAAAYREALRLGHPDEAMLRGEIERIRRATATRIFHERVGDDPPAGLHVYLSAPGRAFAEHSKADLGQGLGGSDYSYAFAMRGFAEALDALGVSHSIIANPEFVADIRPRSDAALNLHLGFYPPERMRLLKGARNIACFAWEFERLRLAGEVTGYHAFADQGAMLALADEIWLPSSEGAAVVAAATDRPVRHVAAPVLSNHRAKPRPQRAGWREADGLARALDEIMWQPLAVLPRIQGTMNDMARARAARLRAILRMPQSEAVPPVFVTVLNVHDYRKQLRPMIEGFLRFSADHPDALLLIKMTTPDRGKLTINEFLIMDQISDAGRLVPPMVSDRVWITDNLLTRDEMNALFDLAGCYLCTSHAEGQNLPLIEAMARGCVPVSPDHSAMRDYLTAENAILIPSTLEPAEPRLTTRYGLWGIRTNMIAPDAVADALARAVAMDEGDRAARAAAAQAMVRDRFGLEPFRLALEAAVAGMGEPPAAEAAA